MRRKTRGTETDDETNNEDREAQLDRHGAGVDSRHRRYAEPLLLVWRLKEFLARKGRDPSETLVPERDPRTQETENEAHNQDRKAQLDRHGAGVDSCHRRYSEPLLLGIDADDGIRPRGRSASGNSCWTEYSL